MFHGSCKPKPTIDTHTQKREESKHNNKDSPQTTREENKRGREQKKKYKNKPKSVNKKMSISAYTSIITLNMNGLNAPIKRHRVAEWIQKQNPHTCCLQETHFRVKDTYRLKVRDERR